MKRKDIYETWEQNGEMNKVLAFIKECASNLVTQREMCEYLDITEVCFSNLKKQHHKLQKMIKLSLYFV